MLTPRKIFGWQFEHLGMMVQQHWYEALLATGHVKEAMESLHHIQVVKTSNGESRTDQKMLPVDWVLGRFYTGSLMHAQANTIRVQTTMCNEL